MTGRQYGKFPVSQPLSNDSTISDPSALNQLHPTGMMTNGAMPVAPMGNRSVSCRDEVYGELYGIWVKNRNGLMRGGITSFSGFVNMLIHSGAKQEGLELPDSGTCHVLTSWYLVWRFLLLGYTHVSPHQANPSLKLRTLILPSWIRQGFSWRHQEESLKA